MESLSRGEGFVVERRSAFLIDKAEGTGFFAADFHNHLCRLDFEQKLFRDR